MFRFITAFLVAAVLSAHGLAAPVADPFEHWNLEPGVGQAHLVMVAKVTSISQVTIIAGAKTDTALREYRFQPVRRLKGLFQRDQLSMTASDLGLPADDGTTPPPLKEGEYRLLILAQPQGRSLGCVSATPGATTFAERVPLLSGPDDPLINVVETLILVADSRSRRERAAMVVKRLAPINGLPAVPLLNSLRLRADWAAADEQTLPALTRLARDPAAAVRNAAIETLRDVLAQRIKPQDAKALDAVAEVLRESLTAKDPTTQQRLTLLEALGHLLAVKRDLAWPRDLLITELNTAATHAERAEAATALSHLADPAAIAAVMMVLEKLPLDEAPARVAIYARAAIRLNATAAEAVLLKRVERALPARQAFDAEIDALGRMKSKASLPLLLSASVSAGPVNHSHLAWAFGKLKDDAAVPVLTTWLRGEDSRLREAALAALEVIDSPLAAREVRPLLKSEGHLAYKLRIARLLARHTIQDGYALATEHLADHDHTAAAALVLAALNDPRTVKDLNAILTAHPDRRWHAAALTGLAATGDAAARQQLLTILTDDRNPLVVDAALAAGLTNDAELLTPLVTLVQSRNRNIAKAALLAVHRYASGVKSSPRGLAESDEGPSVATLPAKTRTAMTTTVAALVLDPYVDADLRQDAFAVAKLLRGENYSKFLNDVAEHAELEGSTLLDAVDQERRKLAGIEWQ